MSNKFKLLYKGEEIYFIKDVTLVWLKGEMEDPPYVIRNVASNEHSWMGQQVGSSAAPYPLFIQEIQKVDKYEKDGKMITLEVKEELPITQMDEATFKDYKKELSTADLSGLDKELEEDLKDIDAKDAAKIEKKKADKSQTGKPRKTVTEIFGNTNTNPNRKGKKPKTFNPASFKHLNAEEKAMACMLIQIGADSLKSKIMS